MSQLYYNERLRMKGRFNIEDGGPVYDKDIPYKMILIIEFNEHNREIGKKVFYFRSNRIRSLHQNEFFVLPDFKTEKEVEEFYNKYKNYSRFECERTVKITVL